MKVILAEKPSVAKSIAKVVKANTKKDGYFEGNGYKITWAVGHLVSLKEPSSYQENPWSLNSDFLFPKIYKYKVNEKTKKQFEIVKNLFTDASTNTIINAADAGREGELIYRLIYNKINPKNKILKRLWISSMTDEAIKKGLENLKDNNDYNNLFLSATCRGKADWLIGMNSTIRATLISKSKEVISLGRVQTPTFAMVTKRFLDNKNFKPSIYYINNILLEKDNIKFEALLEDKFKTLKEAKKYFENTEEKVVCSFAEKTKKQEKTPLPFDLTSLQIKANKTFSLTAQETLTILQGLYEKHKIVTYPRTDSRYITKDMLPYIPNTINKILEIKDFKKFKNLINIENDTCINDKKVSDHHAIIPTGVLPSNLNDKENKIFSLVVKQFLSSFSIVCEKAVTTYHFKFKGLEKEFKSKGTVILNDSWRNILNTDDTDDTDQYQNSKLPNILKDDILKINSKNSKEKKTKAPALLSESTLLRMMETCGKDFIDENLNKEIKDKGIGTPATRASIIETIINRNYIYRDKKHLYPTEKGLNLFNLIKTNPICDLKITGEWEKKLLEIENGSLNEEVFMKNIENFFINEIHPNLQILKDKLKPKSITCPKCKKGNITSNSKAYGCNNYKSENNKCDFVIFKTIAGKTLTEKQIKELIKSKKLPLIKGFKSKAGKTFNASLKLDENFKVKFVFI